MNLKVSSHIKKTTILLLCFTLPLLSWSQDIDVDALILELGIRESAVASRDMPGWSRPTKITMQYRDLPAAGIGSAEWVKKVTDGIEIELLHAGADANSGSLAGSDVYLGWCNNEMNISESLDYIHIMSAGIDGCETMPGILTADLITTNNAKAHSETIAEHSIALMLAMTRNLHVYRSLQMNSEWQRGGPSGTTPSMSVKGKTMLVLGLGGIGTQVASRAYKLGMRVIGTRNSSRQGPEYIAYVGLSDETAALAKEADFVVNALPLTNITRRIVGPEFFNNLKDGAYYISVGRGATTDTEALIAALKSGKLNGAGLDVTDPEPLPADHELWTMQNVIITQHTAGRSDLTTRNVLIIARENLRRYIRGEKLLNMVDLNRGY